MKLIIYANNTSSRYMYDIFPIIMVFIVAKVIVHLVKLTFVYFQIFFFNRLISVFIETVFNF